MVPSVRWLARLHRCNQLMLLVPGYYSKNIIDPHLAKEIRHQYGSPRGPPTIGVKTTLGVGGPPSITAQ